MNYKCGELAWLRGWIGQNPQWSRKQIARELCRRWDWVDGRGRLKDFAARSLLLKLEGRGQVKLPALRTQFRRVRPKVASLEPWEEPPTWTAALAEIAPVRLEKIQAGSPAAKRWAYYLDHYHYLGFRVVGENVGYLACDRQERDVGCLLFGAAAWRCAPRDRRLGWNCQERPERLWRVVNHTRLLILPWVRVAHLASHVLGRIAQRLSSDWQAKYGHPLYLLETFVAAPRFAGTCYRAAGWVPVGLTTGRTRNDDGRKPRTAPKAIYLKPLSADARQQLSA